MAKKNPFLMNKMSKLLIFSKRVQEFPKRVKMNLKMALKQKLFTFGQNELFSETHKTSALDSQNEYRENLTMAIKQKTFFVTK